MGNIITKKTLIIIVIIVIIGWFTMSSLNAPSVKDTMPETSTSTSVIATSTKTTARATTTARKTVVPVASQPVTMSYQNALETYRDNKRIQISGTDFCQVSPNNVMYKNGTSIMLDNRSSLSQTIKLGGATHVIGGYGFKIVNLSSGTLPTTLLMDCGTQQNVAKVLLQR